MMSRSSSAGGSKFTAKPKIMDWEAITAATARRAQSSAPGSRGSSHTRHVIKAGAVSNMQGAYRENRASKGQKSPDFQLLSQESNGMKN
jgi:hypothetical protein